MNQATPVAKPKPSCTMREDTLVELTSLLNRHSEENASDTPDFILAQYLADCEGAWNRATRRRDEWYGQQCGDGARILTGKPSDAAWDGLRSSIREALEQKDMACSGLNPEPLEPELEGQRTALCWVLAEMDKLMPERDGPCTHDPRETKGPIGMYHCPECGDMVVAGMPHGDSSIPGPGADTDEG